jgi:hypothetical protein
MPDRDVTIDCLICNGDRSTESKRHRFQDFSDVVLFDQEALRLRYLISDFANEEALGASKNQYGCESRKTIKRGC